MPIIVLTEDKLRKSGSFNTILIGDKGGRIPIKVTVDIISPTITLTYEHSGEALPNGTTIEIRKGTPRSDAMEIPRVIQKWLYNLNTEEQKKVAKELNMAPSTINRFGRMILVKDNTNNRALKSFVDKLEHYYYSKTKAEA